MSGGGQYWNEDTQRWEDSGEGGTGAPSTGEPTAAPGWPVVSPWGGEVTAEGTGSDAGNGSGGSRGGDAAGSAAAGTVPEDSAREGSVPGAEATAGADSSVGAPDAGAVPTPSAAPAVPPLPGGWPGAGSGSGWHGPGAEGTVADGGEGAGTWSSLGATAGGVGSAPEWASGASWPPVEPPSQQPAPAAGLNRRLLWSVVVGAAVVGVAVSLVLTLVVGKGDGGGKKPVAVGSSAVASASPTESPSTLAEDTGTASASASAPPAGYELRNDAEGFRIAVPTGWTRSSVGSVYGIAVVNYRSADSRHRLQVYQVQESSPDASFELYLSDQTPKPAGFKELGLQNLDDGQFTGSRLEYLAGSISGEPDVGTWHVYDERFVAQDGNIYAIASYGPASDGRADELAELTTALDWFCPPSTTCDAAPSTG